MVVFNLCHRHGIAPLYALIPLQQLRIHGLRRFVSGSLGLVYIGLGGGSLLLAFAPGGVVFLLGLGSLCIGFTRPSVLARTVSSSAPVPRAVVQFWPVAVARAVTCLLSKLLY